MEFFFAGQLRIILHYRCGNDFLLMWELYFGRWENYFGKAGGKIVLAGGETILAGGKLMWRLGKLFWLVKELMWQVGKLFWQVKIVFGIQSERVNSSIMEWTGHHPTIHAMPAEGRLFSIDDDVCWNVNIILTIRRMYHCQRVTILVRCLPSVSQP